MVKQLLRALPLVALALLVSCASAPKLQTRQGFAPVPANEQIYIVPFDTIMVPAEVQEGIFDQFVDDLNADGKGMQYEFVILKQGLAAIDPAWQKSHYYITGTIFGYVEESGCCATTIRVRSRLELHQPDQDKPVLSLEYPREVFFQHDYTSVVAERRKLSRDISATLAKRLIGALSGA